MYTFSFIFGSCRIDRILLSVFLAVKRASSSMLKTHPESGKEEPGGSIIMTASGEQTSSHEVRSAIAISNEWLHPQWLAFGLEQAELIIRRKYNS
jgi:hypothetical protein